MKLCICRSCVTFSELPTELHVPRDRPAIWNHGSTVVGEDIEQGHDVNFETEDNDEEGR